ncbi:DHH family phosphoesterase [Desulfobotulus sp. H1]|uniref:DHH family phosphoesterase n=1 Tax=Desulfobotulus pelophilus TaxID=2823377 RepID=A0ABT3NCI0_9BACT|nr:DHH family phosphoesterase [Desulfobotulus pelophilus]MCW7755181.1 DHH family phosphoesterase [Desulfobotulus pelophilus]
MIRNLLNESSHLLLVSHVQPDGDAIGSLLALGLSLQAQGKHVTMYNEDGTPPSFAFLPGTERVTEHPGELAQYDTLIVLDSGDTDRMGSRAQELMSIPCIINIDHHPSNTLFGSLNMVDPEAASTTVMVWRLLQQMEWHIPTEAAWAIYTGIFTDTGGFRFGNTNTEALSIAAAMTSLGADPETVSRHIMGSYSFAYIRLLQEALSSIRLAADGKLASMTLTRHMLEKTGATEGEASGLVNYARYIDGVKMAALIREKDTHTETEPSYKISLRADGDMDAAAIAVAHGGGGHRAAAGFSTSLPPESILKMLETCIQTTKNDSQRL